MYYINIVNFTVKRGPNKRRIKPPENNELLALALGVEEESEEDDEDFEVDSEDEEGSRIPLQYTYLSEQIVSIGKAYVEYSSEKTWVV